MTSEIHLLRQLEGDARTHALQRAEAAEARAENVYHLWIEDRERLHRWQLACLILVLLIVSGLAGAMWSHLQ